MRPAASAVGARGRSIPAQREECHHLAPAETFIPLQWGLRSGDPTASAHYLNMHGHNIKAAALCTSLHVKSPAPTEAKETTEYSFSQIHLCEGPFHVSCVITSLSAQIGHALGWCWWWWCLGGVVAQQHLKEEVTAFSRDRRQSHIHFSIFTNNRAGPLAVITQACRWRIMSVCVCCVIVWLHSYICVSPIVKRWEGVVNLQQMIEKRIWPAFHASGPRNM